MFRPGGMLKFLEGKSRKKRRVKRCGGVRGRQLFGKKKFAEQEKEFHVSVRGGEREDMLSASGKPRSQEKTRDPLSKSREERNLEEKAGAKLPHDERRYLGHQAPFRNVQKTTYLLQGGGREDPGKDNSCPLKVLSVPHIKECA